MNIITKNLPGFFEFTYMRMDDNTTIDFGMRNVKDKIVSQVNTIEPTNYYEEEEMHWIEIVLTFDNKDDAQSAIDQLAPYMII